MRRSIPSSRVMSPPARDEACTEEGRGRPECRRDPASRVRIRLRSELEDRPAALAGDAAQLAVGIDDDGMPDGLEERQVGMAVRVRRAVIEVEPAMLRELAHAFGLV